MVTYNCEPFVLGPELAIESTPRPVCVRFGLNSSSNGLPQIDLPPAPVPVGSPPCICKKSYVSIAAKPTLCEATCNEIPDGSVEQYIIVISIGAMFNEIITGAWNLFAEQFQVKGTEVCVQAHIAVLLDPFILDKIIVYNGCLNLRHRHHGSGCKAGGNSAG